MTSDRFWSEYRAFVGRILAPLDADDGVPEEEIVRAEERLGFRLPRLLREFYLLTGRRTDINGAQDMLVEPECLEVAEGDVLVFHDENQSVVLWGIRLSDIGRDNPPVVMADNDKTLVWEPAHEHLSEFLFTMLLWQAVSVSGGMFCCGLGTADRKRIASPPAGWKVIRLGGNWQARALLRDGQLLFYVGDDQQQPEIEVSGGARSLEALEEMAEAFSVEWAYCDYEDRWGETPEEDSAEMERRRQVQIEKAKTPFGDALCAGCGEPLRLWADTSLRRCSWCGHALDDDINKKGRG
jgi:hypothetical protein